ncbi:MAG: response regulator [Opitutaceae bacterium]|nr:response regulator [Opitutaceae bacterium]
MRLLVVDDSKAMRTMICAYAGDLGYETNEAADGIDALEALERSQDYEAIMLDWDMPKMDGLTALKIIREDRRFDAIKIMMVTAQGSYENVAQALEAGANDYLMKPFDEQMFAEKMRILGLVV